MSEFHEYELSRDDFAMLNRILHDAIKQWEAPNQKPYTIKLRREATQLKVNLLKAFTGKLYFEKEEHP